MCGMWNVDDLDCGSQYIVLDDFNIEYFPNWKPILGCQKQFTVTDKYRGKRTVKNWGKPCIWVCNKGYSPVDSDKLSLADKEWIAGNCIMVDIGNKSILD